MGSGYLILTLVGAWFFPNPPSGYHVPGFSAATSGPVVERGKDSTEEEALRTPQWYLLMSILALNVAAGIALISQAAATPPTSAVTPRREGGGLVGIMAVSNGGGRIMWAAISDYTGRMPAFAAMLGLPGMCLPLIPHASNAALIFILTAVIYGCYGGGFGTMPATVGDYFGVPHTGAIYGLMILGWSGRHHRPGGYLGAHRRRQELHPGVHGHRGHRPLATLLTAITKIPRTDRSSTGA